MEHIGIIGKAAVAAFKKNGFDAEYFDNSKEAKISIYEMIPDGASVGFGGSTTIEEMDLQQMLLDKGCIIYDHAKGITLDEKLALRRMQLQSDVFLTSSNAITRDGNLYNIDAIGNRVAAMIFGPKQVIVVVGINKLVSNVEAARERVKTISAPINNIRLKMANPCVETGVCNDCHSPARICKAEVILHRKPSATAIKVVIIGEEMGY